MNDSWEEKEIPKLVVTEEACQLKRGDGILNSPPTALCASEEVPIINRDGFQSEGIFYRRKDLWKLPEDAPEYLRRVFPASPLNIFWNVSELEEEEVVLEAAGEKTGGSKSGSTAMDENAFELYHRDTGDTTGGLAVVDEEEVAAGEELSVAERDVPSFNFSLVGRLSDEGVAGEDIWELTAGISTAAEEAVDQKAQEEDEVEEKGEERGEGRRKRRREKKEERRA